MTPRIVKFSETKTIMLSSKTGRRKGERGPRFQCLVGAGFQLGKVTDILEMEGADGYTIMEVKDGRWASHL